MRHGYHIALVLKLFTTFQKKFKTLDIGTMTQDLTVKDSRRAVMRQLYDGRHFISVMITQEVGCGAWTGLSWLRIGTGGGHL